MAAHLASAAELAPPTASTASAQKWVAAADALMSQSASFRANHMAALQQCEQTVEGVVQAAFADLQQQACSLTLLRRLSFNEFVVQGFLVSLFKLQAFRRSFIGFEPLPIVTKTAEHLPPACGTYLCGPFEGAVQFVVLWCVHHTKWCVHHTTMWCAHHTTMWCAHHTTTSS